MLEIGIRILNGELENGTNEVFVYQMGGVAQIYHKEKFIGAAIFYKIWRLISLRKADSRTIRLMPRASS